MFRPSFNRLSRRLVAWFNRTLRLHSLSVTNLWHTYTRTKCLATFPRLDISSSHLGPPSSSGEGHTYHTYHLIIVGSGIGARLCHEGLLLLRRVWSVNGCIRCTVRDTTAVSSSCSDNSTEWGGGRGSCGYTRHGMHRFLLLPRGSGKC